MIALIDKWMHIRVLKTATEPGMELWVFLSLWVLFFIALWFGHYATRRMDDEWDKLNSFEDQLDKEERDLIN